MRFSNMKIAYRLLVVVLVGALGLAIFTFVSLNNLRSTLESERENKTKEHVDVAQTLIRGMIDEATRNGRSTKEAQRQALNALRAVRYAGEEYYWVNDSAGTMLMHPIDKALENTSVMGVRNSNGVAIFVSMIDVARNGGGGFYRF